MLIYVDQQLSACIESIPDAPDPQRCGELCYSVHHLKYAGYHSYDKFCCCNSLPGKFNAGPFDFYCYVV